jgi:aminomethyltransferase
MSGTALLHTPLHAWHQAHGARMVEFGGWSMPVQYTSIIEEHQAVRSHVGLFDISHMGRLRFEGSRVLEWLERATTNHVARLKPGQIQYSLICREDGGIVDDVLVYRLPDGSFAMVCNASNREHVIAQLEQLGPPANAVVRDRTRVTAMIAVQGPDAGRVVEKICDETLVRGLGYYRVADGSIAVAPGETIRAYISRTGYTGEDGFELIFDQSRAVAVWERLLEVGKPFLIRPCGLGARDTLRFEAAMPLYGHEMDETVNPYSAVLGWAVKLDKGDFVGRQALRHLKERPVRMRVGLRLEGKRIARQGSAVLQHGQLIGTVTSGTFAPTLGRSLAMALVRPESAAPGTRVSVDIRGQLEPAELIPLPFYKRPARPETTGA